MITLEFTPWSPFHAKKDTAQIHSWLEKVAKASEQAFKKGASIPWPGSGAFDFVTPGSQPGEWPMRRSGTLIGSIDTKVGNMEMTIGSGAISPKGFDYSSWLKKRGNKMSKEALEEGLQSAGHLTKWVEWSRG